MGASWGQGNWPCWSGGGWRRQGGGRGKGGLNSGGGWDSEVGGGGGGAGAPDRVLMWRRM